MNGNCVAILARNHEDLAKALKNQGFLMVAELKKPIRIDTTRRGMLIARVVR